jgi:hypothetical protein
VRRGLLAAAIALLAVATVAPAASASAAAGRLDRLVQELRVQPLAIDSELSWYLSSAQRRRLERTLRASPVAIRVALVPQVEDDESGGDGSRIAVWLHRRLGRPGIYVVVDEHGYFDVGSWAVPREVDIPFGLSVPSSGERDTRGAVVRRLQRLVSDAASAPRGETTDDPEPYLRPLEPWENWRLHRYGDSTGDMAFDAAVAGGILGLFAGGLARLRTRRETPRMAAPTRRRRRRRRR